MEKKRKKKCVGDQRLCPPDKRFKSSKYNLVMHALHLISLCRLKSLYLLSLCGTVCSIHT